MVLFLNFITFLESINEETEKLKNWRCRQNTVNYIYIKQFNCFGKKFNDLKKTAIK
jgi:hypothetical protein